MADDACVSELVAMGFSVRTATRALRATQSLSANECVEWIIMNPDEAADDDEEGEEWAADGGGRRWWRWRRRRGPRRRDRA
jgi:hypothetical protein